MRICGPEILRGNEPVIRELKRRKGIAIEQWQTHERISHIRMATEKLWQQKDYAGYVSKMVDFDGALTELDAKRIVSSYNSNFLL